MAVPRKKVSIAKKHQRTSTWRTLKIKKMMNKMKLVSCKQCKTMKLQSHVCPNCGYYKDTQVLTVKANKSEAVIEA
jgi:large subunit ribosomal protein L32